MKALMMQFMDQVTKQQVELQKQIATLRSRSASPERRNASASAGTPIVPNGAGERQHDAQDAPARTAIPFADDVGPGGRHPAHHFIGTPPNQRADASSSVQWQSDLQMPAYASGFRRNLTTEPFSAPRPVFTTFAGDK